MAKFKLTDVEGKEHILEVIKDAHIERWDIKPAKPVEPEIKVGMWVKFLPEVAEKLRLRTEVWNEKMILRVDSILGDCLWFDNQNIISGGSMSNDIKCFVPATPAEIEAHLKKVCEAKYPAGTKYKPINSVYIYTVPEEPEWTYSHAGFDTMICGSGLGLIYAKGQFAEIIPDKKKKPETREEVEQLLTDYSANCEKMSIPDFLNQYEI